MHFRIKMMAWPTLAFFKLQFSGGRWADIGLILLGDVIAGLQIPQSGCIR